MTDSPTIKSFKKAVDAFLETADYVSFMQEQLPDEMWCTDPEFHHHSKLVAKVTMAVIACVDTHENSKAAAKAESRREAAL